MDLELSIDLRSLNSGDQLSKEIHHVSESADATC
jgi:hypothetical protein